MYPPIRSNHEIKIFWVIWNGPSATIISELFFWLAFLFPIAHKTQKKGKRGFVWTYFVGLAALGLGFALDAGFSSLTCFIGVPQQTTSQSSQPQTSSTRITSPQLSHLYFSPFFFAKNFTSKENSCSHIAFLEKQEFYRFRFRGKKHEPHFSSLQANVRFVIRALLFRGALYLCVSPSPIWF
jgi:hypothetical protein